MNNFTLLIFDEKSGKIYNSGTFDNAIHAFGKVISIMESIINLENSSGRENYIISEIIDIEDDAFSFSLSKYENDNYTDIITAMVLSYEVSKEEYKKRYQFDPVISSQCDKYCVLSYVNSGLINNLGVYISYEYALGVGMDYFQSLIDEYNNYSIIKNTDSEVKSYRIINSFDEKFKTDCYKLYTKDKNAIKLNLDCSFCVLEYTNASNIIDDIRDPNKLI